MPWTEINGVKTFVAADATTENAPAVRPAGSPGGKKSWFAQHKVATAVLATIVVVGGATAFSGGSTPTAAGDKAGSSSSTTQNATLTNAQKADKAANAVKGAKVDQYGAKLSITFPIGDNISDGLRRAGVAMDTFKLMKGLKDHGVDFDVVTINGTFDLLDQFGAELKDQHVFNADFSQATVNRIVYDNIARTELDVLNGFSSVMWLHPAFGWQG